MSSMATLRQLRTSASLRKRISIGLRLVIAVFLIIFSIFPILWVISASINPTGSLATQKLIPENPGLDNYHALLTSGEFPFWTMTPWLLWMFILGIASSRMAKLLF